MRISSDHIRNRIGTIWPDLKFAVLTDPDWLLPSIDDVRSFLNQWRRPEYIEHLYECEESALELVVTQRRIHAAEYTLGARLPAERYNWPLGIVIGTRFHGVDVDHFQNICLTQSGIVLIEPQTGEIWEPRSTDDQIYFVIM